MNEKYSPLTRRVSFKSDNPVDPADRRGRLEALLFLYLPGAAADRVGAVTTALGVLLMDRLLEIDLEDVRRGQEPGEDVAQLLEELSLVLLPLFRRDLHLGDGGQEPGTLRLAGLAEHTP